MMNGDRTEAASASHMRLTAVAVYHSFDRSAARETSRWLGYSLIVGIRFYDRGRGFPVVNESAHLMIDSPMIHVSSLNALSIVTARLPSYDLLTLLSPDYPLADFSAFACGRHLRLAFHDIVEPMPGLVAPDRELMRAVLEFGRRTGPQRALLIHCWAGISRSSAAAFAMACERNPGFERDIAIELRRRSPSSTPNRLMVRLADDLLDRKSTRLNSSHGGISRMPSSA